ncbi:MAG: diguanylate cyclase [Frankiaceae bacterium]|nr:diguanylate cyclase [Frankiaceae bacterium]
MAESWQPSVADVLASSAVGHAIVGLDGVVLEANDALARLLGYQREHIAGQPLLSFAHPDNKVWDAEAVELMRTGQVPAMTRIRRYVHSTGRAIWVKFSISLVQGPDGDAFSCVIADVSDFVAVERHSKLLLEVLEILADAPDFTVVVRRSMERLCRDTPWRMAQLWLPVGDGDVLACAEPWHDDHGATALRDASMGKASSDGTGLVGIAWDTRAVTWWRDTDASSTFARADIARACGIRTAIAIPLVAYGQAIGVVELFSPDVVAGDEPSVALVTSVATHLGSAVARRRDEQTIRDSELRLRAITGAVPVAVVTTDAAGRIVGWNAAAEALFGTDEAGALGRPGSALVVPELRAEVTSYIDDPSQSSQDVSPVVVRCMRADGVEFPAEVSVTSWMWLGAPQHTAIFRDVSAQRAAEADRRLHSDRLAAIVGVQNEVLRAALSASAMQHLVVERAKALVVCDGATLEMLDGRDMVCVAAAGSASDYVGLRLDQATTMSGLCVRSGEPQACEDTETDDRVHQEASRQIGARAMLIVPLFDASKAIGSLKVTSGATRAWTDDDIRTLQLLASSIGTAMLNARQHEDAVARADRAMYDELTGLPGRELLADRMTHAHVRMRRDRQETATFFIDLDGFKSINDNLGHAVGDELLVAVAARLHATLRASDTAARIGGDEFVAFCEDVRGPGAEDETVRAMATRMVDAMNAPYELSSRSVTVTASIGVVVNASPDSTPEVLLAAADEAMYVANGRERPAHVLPPTCRLARRHSRGPSSSPA